MNFLRRSFVAGLACGIAVTAVETWLGVINMMSIGMPALPSLMIWGGLASIALGGILGLLLSPALKLKGGVWAHLLAVTVAWIGLEYWFALDPTKVAMWVTGPVAGALLVVVGRVVARRYPRLPLPFGIAMLVCAVATPVIVGSARSSAPEILAESPASPDAPDVIVIVLDTVRAANVSAYGYGRETTPRFDRLAGEGALFLEATSPSTWSLPSHASLFTGLYPSVHATHGESRYLHDDLETMAETFARAGYDTQCFTANPHISDSFGLTQGFVSQDRAWAEGAAAGAVMFINRLLDSFGMGAEDKGGAGVAENFEHWVSSRDDGATPAFVFLNFIEAHFPYHQLPDEYLHKYTDIPEDRLREHSIVTFAAQFGRTLDESVVEQVKAPTRDMYDAGILYTDMLLGRLVDALSAVGRLDSTVLVVLADHGELLGEHSVFGHGASMHEEDLHVPLFVRYPPVVERGQRVARPVSTAGVFATVAELAGITAPVGLHVGSLLRPDPESAVLAERYLFVGRELPDSDRLARNVRFRVLREGSHKLAVASDGATYLFDLASKEGENRDLSETDPVLLGTMLKRLRAAEERLSLPRLDAVLADGEVPELDEGARQRLEALGYVD
ncbi:MAG: arylsulfatase A-like enzyme [Hyphomicrobiaceae bacterium]|jgi:arylsulfatase A-like enzyme